MKLPAVTSAPIATATTAGSSYPSSRAQIKSRQKLIPGLFLGSECSEHTAGDHGHLGLMHASGCHAFVRRLNHNADAMGLESGVEAIGDLRRHFFLNLQAARKCVDQTGELGDADHPVARQISDVNASDNGCYVMLAMRLETNVTQQDHFVITTDLLERPL